MLREDPPKQRFLSHEEYLKVLNVCKDDEIEIIQFIANTGVRASEAKITWDNISEDLMWITVLGKGRKQRLICTNQLLRDMLSKYQRKPDTIIQFLKSGTKNSYKRRNLYKLCCQLAKRADIPRFGPHALRHYFCTQLLAAGRPLAKVSLLLGHASIRTTETIYNHIHTESLLGTTECLVDNH